LFAAVAVIWTALTWSDPRGNAVAVSGPLLAPLSLLALLPLVAQLARRPFRRAAQTLSALALATIVAGVDGVRLPFENAQARIHLDIAGNKSPLAAASALAHALAEHRLLFEEAAVLVVASTLLPYLRGRGRLVAALSGGSLFAATALAAPSADLLPVLVAALSTAAFLAFAPSRTSER
jgi:hypothetical protein